MNFVAWTSISFRVLQGFVNLSEIVIFTSFSHAFAFNSNVGGFKKCFRIWKVEEVKGWWLMPIHVQEKEGHTQSNLVHYHKTCFTTSYLLSRLLKVIDLPWLSPFVMKQGLGFFSCWYLYGVKAHYKGGQKCCHIVLFSRGVCVWTSTMIILEHIFPNFLHNMVDYNTKISIAKNVFFQPTLWGSKVYLWQKNVHHYVPKNANILKKWLKWFLAFMKFVVFFKHYDSIWLE